MCPRSQNESQGSTSFQQKSGIDNTQSQKLKLKQGTNSQEVLSWDVSEEQQGLVWRCGDSIRCSGQDSNAPAASWAIRQSHSSSGSSFASNNIPLGSQSTHGKIGATNVLLQPEITKPTNYYSVKTTLDKIIKSSSENPIIACSSKVNKLKQTKAETWV